MQSQYKFHQFVHSAGFHRIAVRMQIIRALDVCIARRVRQHMHYQPGVGRVFANPFQYLKAIYSRHVEVQQQDIWKRIIDAVAEALFTFQVSECLHAIAHGVQSPRHRGLLVSAAKKEDIVRIILSK